ncbi:hypothetical protein [Actinoplanes sp. NBRC 103695]|uniref:tetratricopeptide repeat protein n=1 Tax=Actinoplanes sp. NBRC 103695 TaxID=3032202 RepID=UPI00249F9BBD|nr:hypothetical protein [Actinoplanes sp. NBRC 103695]GLY92853.1 hypothetical protein Acsp02_01090 [Actinoplanes sp. NBRC 103695]
MPHLRTVSIVSVTALAVFAAGAFLGPRETPPVVRSAGAAAATPVDRQAQAIARAQDRLRELPRDHQTWAALGVAYVERARVTADPSLYPRAEGALKRSMAVRPNPDALVGLGALANARHDFGAARTFARRALRSNAYDADAYGVLADASTQLGDAAGATAAVQKMLDLRPGLAAYARASYDLELRGSPERAETLMRQALEAAADPADIAFCRNQLGDLAWNRGDLDGAASEYDAGLTAHPDYQPLLRGRSRVAAARGSVSAALTDAAKVATRTPTPDTLLEYAQLLHYAGMTAQADRNLDLADAAHRVFQANGGTDDLAGAQLALARGDHATAVRLARAEFARRPFPDVADALAQALHQSGQDREALRYAHRAVAGAPSSAAYAWHLAQISLTVGDRTTARAHLLRVRALNPWFSPADGPTARRALAALEAHR